MSPSTTTPAPPPDEGLRARTYTADDLCEILQVSRRAIYEWRRQGILPPPLRLPRGVRWNASTIEEWLKAGGPPAK